MDTLLAKSKIGDNSLTLQQHLIDTEQAALLLFPRSEWATKKYLDFFQVTSHDDFILNLRVAALFHDFGKANSGFQGAIKNKTPQEFRHEHLSALFLSLPTIKKWLEQSSLNYAVVLAAVLSHHLKAEGQKKDHKYYFLSNQNKTEFGINTSLFFNDGQIKDILNRISRVTGNPVPPYEINNVKDSDWNQAFKNLWANADDFPDSQDPNFVLAVKTGLILADSVASGLWRTNQDMDLWLKETILSSPLKKDTILNAIIKPRMEDKNILDFHKFQNGTANLGHRGLVVASCGAGKTLAAYLWANNQPDIARMIFLYPTRGTATEGFADYSSHAPKGDAALVHGTSNYVMDGFLENPTENRQKDHSLTETEQRLFSLGLWNKKFFSATTDQFLGFLSNSYGAICSIPILSQSAIVIDEAHAYDDKMFSLLETFLKEYPSVPVLIMSASLPTARAKKLKSIAGMKVYPEVEDRVYLSDLDEKEVIKRYDISPTDAFTAKQEVINAVAEGKKVLCVYNTVAQCQKEAEEFLQILGKGKVLTYHSRYRLCDREKHHREVVDSFKTSEEKGLVACTTQVCEMSLDLDADVLVTELAPTEALIQRMGRANRHLKNKGYKAKVLVIKPETHLPYSQKELQEAQIFLNELYKIKMISQRDLSDGMIKVQQKKDNKFFLSAFIESGNSIFATSEDFRDIDEFCVPAILDSDVELYKELKQKRKPIDGLVCPVPRKSAIETDLLGKTHLKLASANLYNIELGFKK